MKAVETKLTEDEMKEIRSEIERPEVIEANCDGTARKRRVCDARLID